MRAYCQRWQVVNAIERQEARITTIHTRWVQINALAGLARALNIVPGINNHEEEVRARWNQLRANFS